MEESSTKQRWQERKRNHSGQAWICLCPRKIDAQIMHPFCYENAVKVEVYECIVLSIICHCSTHRRETMHQRYVAKIESKEFESAEQFISF